MSESDHKSQPLPIRFVALDVEEKTAPIAMVGCPRRGQAPTPVSLCGQCGHCEQVTMGITREMSLACDWPHTSAAVSGQVRRLYEVARMPSVCAGPETPVSTLLSYLLPNGDDLIPVLDREAMPLGLVSTAELLALIAADANVQNSRLDAVMHADLRRVYMDVTLADAALLLKDEHEQPLTVVSARGRFLGLVSRDNLLVAIAERS